ncbi:hypothetical protein HII31_07166 [Pseudocercospora fuligena]|uniref:PAS domain-containing protein n=1 Tax=Pseudocercospora fuligena TaxID=685502 RepID=A0A8H6RHL2_9PEZI|nr:hypothetical protein HII31_07166 [Pseudocercospora fuligena]
MVRALCATAVQPNSVLLPDIKEMEYEARKAYVAAELDALDRRMLSEKLEVATQETREQEAKFRSIASHLPIAFYEITPSRDILFGNDAYHDITGLDRDTINSFAFLQAIKQEDSHIFEEG